jgi:hypothetical protein
MVKLVMPMQLENALSPILITLLGMVILVRLEQLSNAESPILVIPVARRTLVKLVQFWNTLCPRLVTLLGMATLVTEVLEVPKTGDEPEPTFNTEYPPNALGIVTAPVAVDAVIVAPPFSMVKVHCP